MDTGPIPAQVLPLSVLNSHTPRPTRPVTATPNELLSGSLTSPVIRLPICAEEGVPPGRNDGKAGRTVATSLGASATDVTLSVALRLALLKNATAEKVDTSARVPAQP